jgi:plastocyanin
VRDPAGRPVADAVVYAIPPAGPSDTKARRTVEVQQIDREFVPYVSVIQTGTAVTFPNRDPILHHVYSFSPAKTFEIKLYTGKSPNAIVFDKSGVVTLGCNIHDWMIGYILVVATPHFARTDKEGAASLRDLPPGTYELHVWHPQQAAEQSPRSLAVEGSTKTDFTLEVLPRKPKYKPPLDRLKY